MISQGIWNLLYITPAIYNIVGTSIHNGALRKGYTLPAIRFSEVTSTPITSSDGTDTLQYSTFQFDAFASDYNTCHALKDALKGLLTDYTGVLVEGTVIYGTIIKNELDSPLEEGRGGYVFRCLLDYQFAFDASGIPILTPVPEVELDIDDECPTELDIDDEGLTPPTWPSELDITDDE
jgi:hypothetical protein